MMSLLNTVESTRLELFVEVDEWIAVRCIRGENAIATAGVLQLAHLLS